MYVYRSGDLRPIKYMEALSPLQHIHSHRRIMYDKCRKYSTFSSCLFANLRKACSPKVRSRGSAIGQCFFSSPEFTWLAKPARTSWTNKMQPATVVLTVLARGLSNIAFPLSRISLSGALCLYRHWGSGWFQEWRTGMYM